MSILIVLCIGEVPQKTSAMCSMHYQRFSNRSMKFTIIKSLCTAGRYLFPRQVPGGGGHRSMHINAEDDISGNRRWRSGQA